MNVCFFAYPAALFYVSKVVQVDIIYIGAIQAWYVLAVASLLLLIATAFSITMLQRKRQSDARVRALEDTLVTMRKEQTELFDEKEWLLREMHHRVKNNLQTIVSLLESQAGYTKNSEALSAITDSQNRVNAMSIIHHKLFQSQRLTNIGVQSYLPEIVQYLKDSFAAKRHILFIINVQSLDLDVTQAIPIGLIVNEAISNAIKYAFPVQGDDQQISLDLIVGEDQNVFLRIKDNGIGLPPDFDIDSDDCGLGLKLMKGLSEDIEGEFSIVSNGGVTIEVTFIAIAPLGRSAEI